MLVGEAPSQNHGDALAAAVLDSIPSLVMVLDRSGRIVRCNRAFERAFGYGLEEISGRTPWEAFAVPEEAGFGVGQARLATSVDQRQAPSVHTPSR